MAAVGLNVLLAGALGVLLWRFERRAGPRPQAASAAPPSEPSQPKSPASGSSGETAPASAPARLIPIQLSPQRLQSIGVKTGPVRVKDVHNLIRTAGNVDVDEQLESTVQIRFAGWIQKVFVNSTYQYVRKGEPLFTIYSPDLVTTEQEYLLALRNQRLLASSTVPGVASGANSLLTAAAERLRQWSVPEREIGRLKAGQKASQELEIDSPVSGYVTDRLALPHMYAQPETKLYTITGLSTVWVYAAIFQNEIGQIRVGDPATVTVDSYPGRIFSGRVDYIWPQVDPTTRTVKVRLVFPNPSLKLTPGMFVNVSLDIPLGRHLVIPTSGVFQSGTRDIAFVDRGDGYLEPRDVQLGPQAGDEFVVLKGLKTGEQIVTSANFLIDSESQLQAAMGSFVPPPPGAGAAAAMNQGAKGQPKLEFSSIPSPPHKGGNTFMVKLTSPNGQPIPGAQVTVTFFMPAMPAMGMSAMRDVFTLADKGGGLYEGSGQLQSGGTWQVSIVAQRNGQTVAAQQLNVSAGGGM